MGATDLQLLWESNAFEIREGAMVIGRKDADITIPDKSLSKEHARIVRQGTRVEIEDAGSKNGTTVNDRPVDGRVAITPGDVIRLGGIEVRVVAAGGGRGPSLPAVAPDPQARFTITAGERKGTVVPVSAEKPFTIGSKEENSLAVKGEGISRYHAEVVFEKGVWILKDLGSRNGTFIGDRKVDLHELATGDEIQIGAVRLRFAVEEAAPAGARDLVELAKSDPKALVRSPQMRRAVLLVAAAAVTVYLALPGRRHEEPPPPPPVAAAGVVHDTIELLKKEEAGRAHDVVAKALRLKGAQANGTLDALDELTKIWAEHGSPIAFEWKGAQETIDKIVRNAGPQDLDQDCLDWLKAARATAEMEIPNAALRTQADSAMTKGQSDIRSGKLKPGLEQLKDALELYRSMPPGSAFARSSRDRAETLRKLLLDSYRKQAEALMNQEHPPWDDAKDLLGEARRYAEALDERRPIDEKTGVCEINRRDESSLLAATEIVQRNDRPQFAHAKELVESVASTSRCYKDAVAYKNWFKADGLVCGAIRDFDQGQYEVAKGLIGAAARVPDLRPEVIVSLQNMLGLWARIDEAWRTGYDAEQKSDYAHAREQFKTVVGLAPNPANWYRQHAEKELAIVEEDRQSGIDAALRQGVELLDAGKYAEASEKLSQAIAGGGAPCRTQVEDAVARVNKAKGLLKEANRIVVGIKTDRYPWARTVLQLLATYLASNDPDHEAAVQLLARLK